MQFWKHYYSALYALHYYSIQPRFNLPMHFYDPLQTSLGVFFSYGCHTEVKYIISTVVMLKTVHVCGKLENGKDLYSLLLMKVATKPCYYYTCGLR